MEFYASCPEGFESALADELKRLGLSHVRRLKGRATFEGELEEGYRACLWSRLASRVFVVLGRFEAQDADELYDSVYDIAWESIVRPGATIAITARGVTEQLRNTRFSALRAKDALCDRLAETTGRRRCRRPRCSPTAFAAPAPREHKPRPFGRPAVQAPAARGDPCRRGRARAAPRLRRPGAGAGRLDRAMRARADGRRLRK